MSTAVLLGSIWIFILLGLFFALPRLISGRRLPSVLTGGVVVVAVALSARLVPDLVLPVGATHDIQSYQIVSDLVLRGEDVYSSPKAANRHPYLPFQLYWMAAARWGAEKFHLPFVKIVRLAPILADAAIALVIYLRLRDRRAALLGGLLYAVSPVAVYVSAYHGQFDAIPALMILLSLQWLYISPSIAGGWLGVGILIKSWPVLALPSLLAGIKEVKNRLSLLVAAGAVLIAGIAVYILLFSSNLSHVLARSLGYNHGIGVWGYSYLVRLLAIYTPPFSGNYDWLVSWGRWITLAALALIFWFKARHESPLGGVLTTLVAFLALTHAFSIQYLVWVVPFAILEQDWRWLNHYTLGAFAYMFLAYTTLILQSPIKDVLPWPQADLLLIIPAGLPVWLVTVFWLLHRLRAEKPTTALVEYDH